MNSKAKKTKERKSEGKTKETMKGKVGMTTKKQKDLELAKKIIAKLEEEGLDVDERIKDKKWMIEEDEFFFGCEGSHLVGVDEVIEIGEMYFSDEDFMKGGNNVR